MPGPLTRGMSQYSRQGGHFFEKRSGTRVHSNLHVSRASDVGAEEPPDQVGVVGCWWRHTTANRCGGDPAARTCQAHRPDIVGAAAMVTVYPAALSRSFKPKLVPVNLHVDQSGIYADNAPVVRREDITQAYLRPAFDKQVHRMTAYRSYGYYGFSITTPSLPLTIEMMTRSGPLNIDPGGEGPAGEILTALGIPVTTCPPGYRPQQTRRSWGLTAVIVVLFLAAFFGYYFFMVYKTIATERRHYAITLCMGPQVRAKARAASRSSALMRRHPPHGALAQVLAPSSRHR